METHLKTVVLTALFAAASAVVGYLFMAVPNVEGFTAFLFVGGWMLGIGYGIAAALTAALLYFGLNPMGMFPPLLVAQILGSLLAPVAGSLYRKREPGGKLLSSVILGATAVIVTLWYDLLTNLAYPLTAGFTMPGIKMTLIAGIPFSLIHVGTNVLIFILVVPLMLTPLRRYRP